MASKKHLKRDLNDMMGGIIEAAYIYQIANPKEDTKKSNAIVDEAIGAFDGFIVEINRRDVKNRGQHLKKINREIEAKAQSLIEKVNGL